MAANLRAAHPWLYNVFLPTGAKVRFPFNTGDSSARDSLSWRSIRNTLRAPNPRFWEMSRWSTASRSSVALVPRSIVSLTRIPDFDGPDDRTAYQPGGTNKINMDEWEHLRTSQFQPRGRFFRFVGNPGTAAQPAGIVRNNGRYRLYSIKTGVHYVGCVLEGGHPGNKHLLESNSTMAMKRSDLIRGLNNNDPSLGLQLELLTITAPLQIGGNRDGFQVRDLSCLDPAYDYMPGQAIPYGRAAFDGGGNHRAQCAFWRQNFAVPLGRAKARLFLNYGLIHTSANAQNFVLGFDNGNNLCQFVIRDLGDTSWHDDYIRNYLSHFPQGRPVWAAFRQEAQAQVRHVLHNTSSGQYPAPHMVRLAAYSVLTHGFATTLGWNDDLQYEFVTGVFDGFRDYIYDVLGLDLVYQAHPSGTAWTATQFRQLGAHGGYPPGIGISDAQYRQAIAPFRQQSPQSLMRKASWVRARGRTRVGNELTTLIRAEEALLCMALENALVAQPSHTPDWTNYKNALQNAFQGNWPAVV